MGRYYDLAALADSSCKAVVIFGFRKFDNKDILLGLYDNGMYKVFVELDSESEFSYWESQYKEGMFVKRLFYRLGNDAANKHLQSG